LSYEEIDSGADDNKSFLKAHSFNLKSFFCGLHYILLLRLKAIILKSQNSHQHQPKNYKHIKKMSEKELTKPPKKTVKFSTPK
jgi:hypothetical protein